MAIIILTAAYTQGYRRWLTKHVAEAYRLPSDSMAPALVPGDRVMTAPIEPADVKRGATLVFHAWNNVVLIKRVVAVPGDTIAMHAGQLEIDGHAVQEPYVKQPLDASDSGTVNQSDSAFVWQRAHLAGGIAGHDYRPTVGTWGPLVVPPDSVFVLGDNRYNSLDSRYKGFVARSAFFQRPTGIYFSRDPETKTIRWSRIGQRVQ